MALYILSPSLQAVKSSAGKILLATTSSIELTCVMISVVDYGAGNLKSVANALKYLGADFFISGDPEKLMKGDKLIFPGVGHAKSAMKVLEGGLGDMLKAYAASGKQLLGICLGSQVFLDHSEEGDTPCLALIEGNSRKFSSEGLKVPQIGWNNVYFSEHEIFGGIPTGTPFYFVHSYYTVPAKKENVLCSTDYGVNYASGVVKDNIFAVQFHPERSGKWGLKLLENFVKA